MMIVASNSVTLSNVNDGTVVHIAYANSADGTDGFYVGGGGTNLLLNTQSFDNNWTWENIGHSFANGVLTLSSTNKGRLWQPISSGNPNGKTVSVSFNAKISADCDSQSVQVKVGPYDSNNLINITSKDFQLYKVENWQWKSQSGTFSFYVTNGEVDISNLKLEYGSVATPWSPAPSEAHPIYMGTYTDYTQEDSLDPTKYQWSQIKGDDGKDGLGIKSTIITYQLSSSGTTTPTGTWLTTVPTLTKGQYLWTRTTLVYTDNTNEDVYSVSYVALDGNNGTDGVAGKDGVGIKSTTITYQSGTSGTVQPTGTWAANPPSVTGGNYLWTRTVWTYTDGTTETGYSVGHIGANGATGKDGVGVKSTTITYQASTSGTTAPTGTWVANPPSVTGGNYLWTRTIWSYTDGTSETGYSVAKIGEKGDKGDQGIPGATGADGRTSYLHIAYANNADGSGCTTSPDINSSYNYIGTYTDYTSTSSTNPSSYKWVAMFDSTKKRNFTSQPTTPYAVGDTWIDRGSATYFCTTARNSGAFTASDWTMQQLTIASLDSSIQTNLNNSVKTTETYKGVTLNDAGLTATAGSTTVAMNSTDGFLIKNTSGQVFHVDTAGNLTMQGNITAGNISGVNFTGNSLNLAGTLAIGTNGVLSANGGKTVINNSGLTIKDGGLSVEDSKNNQTTYIGNDGTFITNKGEFTGSVTTNKLILTGNDSDINLGGGKFHVDKNGNLTATGASFQKGSVAGSTITGSQFLVGNEYYSPLERSTHNALSATNIGLRTGTSFSRNTNLATESNSINDNYLLKTGNPIRFVGKGEADNGSDVSATSSTKYYQVVNSNVYGELVTISVTYTISNDIPSNGVIMLQQYGVPNWLQYCKLPGGTTAGTHTVTQTVTLPAVSSSNTDNLLFRGETSNYTGNVIISHVKLELGSEATPWNASESDNGANAQISGIPNIISPLTDADNLLWKSYNNAELYGLNSHDYTPTAQTIDASWPSDKYIVHAYNDWSAMRYTSPSGEVFKAGQTYTVAFRARTYTGTKTTGLTFSVYVLSTSTEIANIINPTITPQFTWYQVSFTPTSDIPIDNFRIEPHGDWSNVGGSIYLCDMSVIEGNIVYGVDSRFPFQIASQNPTDISITPVTIDTRNLSSGNTLIITAEVLYNNNYSSIGGTIQVQIGDTIKSILVQKYSIINGYETFTYSIDWNDNYQIGSNVPVTLLFSSLESGSIFVNYVNAYSVSTTLDTNTPISDSYGYVTPYGELRLGYSTTSTNDNNNNMLSDTSSLSYYGGILQLKSTNYDTISANGINYRTDQIQGGYTTNQYNGSALYSSSIDALGLYYNKTSYNSNVISKGVTWNWDEIANSSPSGIGIGGVGGEASWFDTKDGFDVYPNLISNSSFLSKITNWSINNGKFYWTGSSISDGCFCVGFNNGGGSDDMWQHINVFPTDGYYLTLSFWALCWDSDTSNYGSHGMRLNFEQSSGANNAGITFKMYNQPVSQTWTRYTFAPVQITKTMTSNLDHLSIMFHTDNAKGHWVFARPMLNIGNHPKPYKFT